MSNHDTITTLKTYIIDTTLILLLTRSRITNLLLPSTTDVE